MARLDSRTYLGLHLTIGILVAVIGLWAFGALVDAVLDNATIVRFDLASEAWIHDRVTPAGLVAFDILTRIGSPVAMAIIAVVGGGLLARWQRWTILASWSAAFIGGGIIERVLKGVVARNRPEYGTAFLHGHSFSFPSGHAMGSAIGYSMAIYVLLLFWHPRRPWRAAVIGLGVAMVIAIAVSRVYLGVHYPSDVVGGVAAGAGWAAVCVSGLAIAMHRRMGGELRRPAPHSSSTSRTDY